MKEGITLVDSSSQIRINSIIIIFSVEFLVKEIDLKRIKFLIQGRKLHAKRSYRNEVMNF